MDHDGGICTEHDVTAIMKVMYESRTASRQVVWDMLSWVLAKGSILLFI